MLGRCGPREEVGRYATGEVAYRAPLDDQGVFDGEVTYFYENGAVRCRLPFRAHHLNGLAKWYTPQSGLKSTQECRQGKPFGALVNYYPSSRVEYRATLHGRFHVDTARYYYPNGALQQMVLYDARGRKIDFGVWQPNGAIDPRYAGVLFLSAADSVRAGQDFAFEVVLGNRYRSNITLKLLAPARGVDSVRSPHAPTRYFVRHPALGRHLLRANVREEWAREGSDTVWTTVYPVRHAFTVISR